MKKLVLLFFSLTVYGAASICTLPSGTYPTLASTSGLWTGAGCTGSYVAGNGDTATLANGVNLTIAVGETWTIGTSGSSSTVALSCSTATGTAILNLNGTLVYRGGVQNCAAWTVGPSAHIQHDSSLAATPASTNYFWEFPFGCGVTCTLSLNGASDGHIIWDIAVSSGNAGYIGSHSSSGDGGQLTTNYLDWGNIGTASTTSIQMALHSPGATVSIHSSTCTGCAKIAIFELVDGANLSFQNIVVSSIAGSGVAYRALAFGEVSGMPASTSGTREVLNSYLENGAVMFSCASNGTTPHLNFQGNVIYNSGSSVSSGGIIQSDAAGQCVFSGTEWSNNLLWANDGSPSTNASVVPGGTLARTYLLQSNTSTCTSENHHGINLPTGVSTVIDTWIDEPDCAGTGVSNGKFLLYQGTPATSNSFTSRITNTISLPATAGLGGAAGSGSIGEALAFFDDAMGCDGSTTFCPVVTVDHNTVYASDGYEDGLYLKESSTAQSSLVAAVKDNIGWKATLSPMTKVTWLMGTAIPNASISSVGCNWWYNDDGTGYQYHTVSSYAEYTSPTPPGGAVGSCSGDSTGNPGFAAPARNFIRWCKSLNIGDAAWSDCLAHFKSITAAEGGYSPSSLVNWVRGGFTPTNSATATAGDTGGQVGAVAYLSSTSGVSRSGPVAISGPGQN